LQENYSQMEFLKVAPQRLDAPNKSLHSTNLVRPLLPSVPALLHTGAAPVQPGRSLPGAGAVGRVHGGVLPPGRGGPARQPAAHPRRARVRLLALAPAGQWWHSTENRGDFVLYQLRFRIDMSVITTDSI